jgi:predicted DNA-binding protein with PD1-like motif
MKTLAAIFLALPLLAQQPAAPKIKVTEFSKTGRRFEVVLSKGDEIVKGLTEFAEKNHVTTAHFSAIGAIDKGKLGWFDPEKRAYKPIEVNEEVEILTLTGNISTGANGKPAVHAHIIVGMPDGQARGGHLIEGYISLTLQLFLDEEEPAQ